MSAKRTSFLLTLGGVLVLAAGGVVLLTTAPEEGPQSPVVVESGDVKPGPAQVVGSEDPPSKVSRPGAEGADLRELAPGSPEWYDEVIRHLPDSALFPGPRLVESLDEQRRSNILEGLKFRSFVSDVPKLGYKQKQPVPDDWKQTLEILTKTIAFSYGPNGGDPRFSYSDPEYFFYSSQDHEDFSAGYAVRKADGALFRWDLEESAQAAQ